MKNELKWGKGLSKRIRENLPLLARICENSNKCFWGFRKVKYFHLCPIYCLERGDEMEKLELASVLSENRQFLANLQEASQVDVRDCYQCGKCSAGCPLTEAMDYNPHQILRLLQLGLVEKALKSRTIWICANCSTCYARCPKEVDLPRLMETLRIEAKQRGFIGEKTVNLFADLFLASVKSHGRTHEMGMMAFYNLLSGHWFQDAMSAPALFLHGKISPFPHNIKGKEAISKIFAKTKERGGER